MSLGDKNSSYESIHAKTHDFVWFSKIYFIFKYAPVCGYEGVSTVQTTAKVRGVAYPRGRVTGNLLHLLWVIRTKLRSLQGKHVILNTE